MATVVLFPENVVNEIHDEVVLLDPEFTALKRPLRPSDPNKSVGVYGLDWEPSEHEIGGPADPSLARYSIGIQSMVKHATEEDGQALHTNIAHRVRTMLYRSVDLRLRLGQTKVLFDGGIVERVTRWGVSTQRFRSNEIQGQFVYVSVTNFWVDTETVNS